MYTTKWMNLENIVWIHSYEIFRIKKKKKYPEETNLQIQTEDSLVRLHQMGSREFLGDDENDLKLNFGS